MKCVIDPDLLLPPPVPGTPHLSEMVLHQQQLARFNLKVALSKGLQSMLWERYYAIAQRQYKTFLMTVLSRHIAQDFPEEIEIQYDDVTLSPDFLSEIDEVCRTEWLRGVLACYLSAAFDLHGAILATWDRKAFADRLAAQLTYQHIDAEIPVKRNLAEWDLLAEVFAESPIPYTGNLRLYADESGYDGRHEWIAVVAVDEGSANRVVRSVIADFNNSLRVGKSQLSRIHISADLATEQERYFVVSRVVQELCSSEVACFVIRRKQNEFENDLYARAIVGVLGRWCELITPVYVDTPYDRASDERKNIDLKQRVHNTAQQAGMDYRSDDIILGKSDSYPGLGIVDAIAYLYLRKVAPRWRDLWQQLDSCRKCFEVF